MQPYKKMGNWRRVRACQLASFSAELIPHVVTDILVSITR